MKVKSTQSGFALLLTLMIVSVVLSIGLTLLNITLKQFTLSVTGRESEVAFHVAGGMLDCILQHRQNNSLDSDFESGVGPSALNCGIITETSRTSSADTSPSGGTVFHHEYEYDYTAGRGACGEMSIYVFDARVESGDISYSFTGEGLANSTCRDGTVCTVAFARGFNRSCSDLSSLRTVQREFSIRF